ncbi:synaptotagmin-15-like [Ornithodoros turicata]|uniref:synaptotagmin-15-like n=1 Tax=Ornithodoros turicata TaxID=34597 RepID=UPI003138714B
MYPKADMFANGTKEYWSPEPQQRVAVSTTSGPHAVVVDSGPSVLLATVLATVGVLVAVALGFALYGRRRRRRQATSIAGAAGKGPYDTLATNEEASSSCRSSSARLSIRSADPIFYGCLAQDRPIDFVVPGLCSSSTHLVTTTGPSPEPGEASSSLPPSPTEGILPHRHRHSFAGATGTNALAYGTTSLLGGLNPELYKPGSMSSIGSGGSGGTNGVWGDDGEERCFPESHRGRLWFGIEYDSGGERLVVRVVKARNLPSRVCGSINCCDPFVRIYLMPDERRYLQTKCKKKTCNPIFDESYVFQIPAKALEERTLKLTVYDNDRGKRHNVIGHVVFPLRELDITSSEAVLTWRDLETELDVSQPGQGELLVSLSYNGNMERLTVTVFEARSVRPPPEAPSQPPDTLVKVSFLLDNKTAKTKKTAVVKRTCDPKYMESFAFRVPTSSLDAASVVLKLNCAGQTNKGDKCLGRVVLGGFMFARGKAQHHWNQAVSQAPKQVHQWHKLT